MAGKTQVDEIHKKEGVYPVEPGVVCPHASAAAAAAKTAETVAAARAAAGCPAHAKGATNPQTPKAHSEHTATSFNYEAFFVGELHKKHKDQSYRYFDNINRLAAKFPVAHTGSQSDEVDVWCSNDYLGMSKNPVVLETMHRTLNVRRGFRRDPQHCR